MIFQEPLFKGYIVSTKNKPYLIQNNTVSIIITVYNRSHWLQNAIEFALNQSYPTLEVIVVDDGTTNQSSYLIACKFKKVKYIYQNNSGLGSARNKGIDICTGEFIQFLDDDDWLSSESIEMKFNEYKKLSENYLIYSDLYLTNEKGDIESTCFSKISRPLPSGDIFVNLINRNFIPVHSILWKRSILKDLGGFPNHSGHEDWGLLLSASQKYMFAPIDKPLGYYRQHNQGMSNDFNKMMTGKLSFQMQIVQSDRFSLLPVNLQKSILEKYSLQQYAFGSKELSENFLRKLYLISDNKDLRPRFISFLQKMPMKLSQILVKANHFVHKTNL